VCFNFGEEFFALGVVDRGQHYSGLHRTVIVPAHTRASLSPCNCLSKEGDAIASWIIFLKLRDEYFDRSARGYEPHWSIGEHELQKLLPCRATSYVLGQSDHSVKCQERRR
jgi:hypothetical protein